MSRSAPRDAGVLRQVLGGPLVAALAVNDELTLVHLDGDALFDADTGSPTDRVIAVLGDLGGRSEALDQSSAAAGPKKSRSDRYSRWAGPQRQVARRVLLAMSRPASYRSTTLKNWSTTLMFHGRVRRQRIGSSLPCVGGTP